MRSKNGLVNTPSSVRAGCTMAEMSLTNIAAQLIIDLDANYFLIGSQDPPLNSDALSISLRYHQFVNITNALCCSWLPG